MFEKIEQNFEKKGHPKNALRKVEGTFFKLTEDLEHALKEAYHSGIANKFDNTKPGDFFIGFANLLGLSWGIGATLNYLNFGDSRVFILPAIIVGVGYGLKGANVVYEKVKVWRIQGQHVTTEF